MAHYLKIQGLDRGKGLRFPTQHTAYDAGVKGTLSMTANTVKYDAVVGGTWANGGVNIVHTVAGSAPAVSVAWAATGAATITVAAPATATLAANQAVVAAVNAHPTAGQLVTASILGTGAAAHTAAGSAPLASGTNVGAGRTLQLSAKAGGVVAVDIDRGDVQKMLRRSNGRFASLGSA